MNRIEQVICDVALLTMQVGVCIGVTVRIVDVEHLKEAAQCVFVKNMQKKLLTTCNCNRGLGVVVSKDKVGGSRYAGVPLYT
jgi:hypothetical protein